MTTLVPILVRLMNEGTEVARPTSAEPLGNGLYRILDTTDFASNDESWEFAPGTVVRGELRRYSDGEFLTAVKT